MASHLLRHLRHNAVAYVALFVALSSGAYAAIRLPANSVGTKQLKRNAVVSSKVKNGSLLAADFAARQLPAGAKGDAGAAGTKGDPGPQGPAGAKGDAGVKGANGTNGIDGADGLDRAAVRLRAVHSGGDVTVPAANGFPGTSVSLSPNTFTQGAAESNMYFVKVTFSEPATCSGINPGISFSLDLGGGDQGDSFLGGSFNPYGFNGPPPATNAHQTYVPIALETGADVGRTLTLKAQNSCQNNGEDYTIKAAKVIVVSLL